MASTTVLKYAFTILAFVPAIVLHEVAHGFAAMKLGDPTAKASGRLSLNPLKHIDPFGTIILPLCLMIFNMPVFGYAKPVPYNPAYFKDTRKGDFIVGMAGPLANLLQAFLGSAIMWLLFPIASSFVGNDVSLYFYYYFLPQYILINLYLMFFNLIPVPPLDGSSIIALFIPKNKLPQWYAIQAYALPVLILVVIVLPSFINFDPISAYLNFAAGGVASLLIPGY